MAQDLAGERAERRERRSAPARRRAILPGSRHLGPGRAATPKSAWDGWGNLTHFKVDPDSAAGGGGVPTKEISYSYAAATSGRNTLRRTGMTLPGSTTASFVYGSGAANSYSDEASRLQRVEISSVPVVEYDYLGLGEVVGVEYPQPAVFRRKYGSTSGTWPDLDRFGRVVNSRWTKDLSTDMDFFAVQVTYDENSNPLTADEGVYATGFDVKYSIDGLDRLVDAEEGTLSSGSIATRTRRQQWTLSRTGNWDAETRDMNGASGGYGAHGLAETRSHNIVNELTGRSVTTDGGGPTSRTLSHDAAGNLIDDGQDYEYVYDAWHRLVRIEERSSSDVVSEHRYYGNGFRAGERYDSNESGRINSSDKWYWFAYDERWRIVGTFRDADSSPKERFLHHVAGLGGYGSSSYIDDLVLRDRDANTDWNDDASDGTLEERLYYCQNWRHDVVTLVTSGGSLRERVRYTAYGIPVGMPQGDCDGDGDVDAADQTILLGAWGTATAKCDLNLDGTVDAADNSLLLGQLGATAGFGRLSLSGNRFGYAGYAADPAVHVDWHVRHRVLMSGLGRWMFRDPVFDGANLAEYGDSTPMSSIDTFGLLAAALGQEIGPPPPARCPFDGELHMALDDNLWKRCIARCLGRAGDQSCYQICAPLSVCAQLARLIPFHSPAYALRSFCDRYPPNHVYSFANSRCFCMCAGDSDWSKEVRGCLWELWRCDIDDDLAHDACYALADCMEFPDGRPWTLLGGCWAVCTARRLCN